MSVERVGSALCKLIVPVALASKAMISASGLRLAAVIASRNEPAPLSLVLVTAMGPAGGVAVGVDVAVAVGVDVAVAVAVAVGVGVGLGVGVGAIVRTMRLRTVSSIKV